MAEKHLLDGQEGFGSIAVADNENEVNSPTSKRCASSSPPTPPLHKSPRMGLVSATIQTTSAGEMDQQAVPTENIEGSLCASGSSTECRKSWRRATLTRRSLPALPHPYHVLSRSINTSLSQQERLEKLMEASVMLAIERTQNSLQSVPNTSLECFQKQVKHMQKECSRLAKIIRSESQGHQLAASAASNPALQRAMEGVQKAINRFQAENESWETLLNKHMRKAEELERKVTKGQETGLSLDSLSLARSSQYSFIQRKPDYHSLLCRQRPMIHTVEMIMDAQCKMIRDLLSVKEQTQLLVKETSGRLVAEAGYQEISSDLIRNLMAAPLSSAAI